MKSRYGGSRFKGKVVNKEDDELNEVKNRGIGKENIRTKGSRIKKEKQLNMCIRKVEGQ